MRREAIRQLVRSHPVRAVGLFAAYGCLFAAGVAASVRPSEAALGSRRACAAYGGVPSGFGPHSTAGMVLIGGGDFVPGSDHGYPDERGGERVRVPSFWIDRTEVTNAQFARFVAATGYLTVAERAGRAPVFHVPSAVELEARGDFSWWSDVAGASYRRPAGPGAASAAANLPVVQVAYEDALAYARWLGRALPSEVQWEYAAKANRDDASLHREPRDARGRPSANFWQGDFPARNTREDGFERSAPVGCYASKPFGLFDMLGNVWEWTGSPYTSSHRAQDAFGGAGEAERAGAGGQSCSASAAGARRYVIKGGSYLCSATYCARYRVAARHAQEAEQPAMHLGFRTVLAAEL
jgi:formylglycine-generating enzyme required for sulfatase activity